MRSWIIFSIVLLIVFCAPPAFGQKAGLFDELVELFPDSDPASGVECFQGDTPLGVPAGVHALICGLTPGAAVRFHVSIEGRAIEHSRLFKLIDVPVEQNTGLVSRTEVWDGKKNPHVIRKAPFRVFEVIKPVQSEALASGKGVLALRLEIPIGLKEKAGTRLYFLLLESGKWRRKMQWKLTVHSVTVPRMGAQSPGYTNWFSPEIIAKRHGLKVWSELFWEMLGRYADLMARGRQNTFWIRWRDFVRVDESGKVSLSSDRFNAMCRSSSTVDLRASKAGISQGATKTIGLPPGLISLSQAGM